MRYFTRALASLALLGCSCCCYTALAGDQDDEQAAAAPITDRWSKMRQEVVTARLTVIRVILSCTKTSAAPRSSDFRSLILQRLVPTIGALNQASQVKDVMEKFVRQGSPVVADATSIEASNASMDAGAWAWMTDDIDITQQGDVVRNDTRDALQARSMVRTPNSQVSYSPAWNQASADTKRSGVKMYSIADVRFIPSQFDLAAGDQRIESTGSDRAMLRVGNTFSAEYRADTGFVDMARWSDGNGHVFKEVWQFEPFESRRGVLLPRIAADVRYHRQADGDPRIRMAQMYLVGSATLNGQLAVEAFQVSAPADTTIVDFSRTNSAGRPVTHRAEEPVSDVKTYAESLPR